MGADLTDLATLLHDASHGRFPEPDGEWTRIPLWRPGVEAIVAFTGHAFFAVADDITDRRIDKLGADGFGGAHAPSVIAALAGPDAWIDSLDVVLVARTPDRGTSRLIERPDLGDHSRVRLAASMRDDVRVLGYPELDNTSLVTVSRGLGGLPEFGVQTNEATDGAVMLRDGLATRPAPSSSWRLSPRATPERSGRSCTSALHPSPACRCSVVPVSSAHTERLRP